MNEKKLLQFGLLVFIGTVIWGELASHLINALLPSADILTRSLLKKGD
jgi:hypothetical protein